MAQLFSVKIQKLDYRGQGISWDLDRITFIPQALPGEEVLVELTKIQAKQQWGRIKQILRPSSKRIIPSCPHYAQCGGCHYLHLNYPDECQAKVDVLQEQLTRLGHLDIYQIPINVHPAPQRNFYRQRLQLHYDRSENRIGLLAQGKIVEVPHCQLPLPGLKTAWQTLYPANPATRSWPNDIPSLGHVELAIQDGKVTTHWNQPYSADGFCQVNAVMNEQLKEVWRAKFQAGYQTSGPAPTHASGVLDLFGGNGNLSQACTTKEPVLVIDAHLPSDLGKKNISSTGSEAHPINFFQTDLYATDALEEAMVTASSHQIKPPLAWLILDPPRSGHQEIAAWAKTWQAQNILYVSCNAATLARDLASLIPHYQLQSLDLFDFFPGTFHFETMAVLKRKTPGPKFI